MKHIPKVNAAMISSCNSDSEKSLLHLIRVIQNNEQSIESRTKEDKRKDKHIYFMERRIVELKEACRTVLAIIDGNDLEYAVVNCDNPNEGLGDYLRKVLI